MSSLPKLSCKSQLCGAMAAFFAMELRHGQLKKRKLAPLDRMETRRTEASNPPCSDHENGRSCASTTQRARAPFWPKAARIKFDMHALQLPSDVISLNYDPTC